MSVYVNILIMCEATFFYSHGLYKTSYNSEMEYFECKSSDSVLYELTLQ